MAFTYILAEVLRTLPKITVGGWISDFFAFDKIIKKIVCDKK